MVVSLDSQKKMVVSLVAAQEYHHVILEVREYYMSLKRQKTFHHAAGPTPSFFYLRP
jgi:hypothetical protein